MPGSVLHLYVGKELAKHLALDKDLFIAANLAPDAVHARYPYDRKYKKTAHLKNDMRDRELTHAKAQKVFEKGINEFIETISSIENREKEEFFLGYIAHVLTDYFFIQNILGHIYAKCAELKYNSDETQVTGRDFLEEYNAMDNVVISLFPELQDLLKRIEHSKAFDVENYVSKEEVKISRKWTITQIRSKEDVTPDLQYLKQKDFLRILESAVEYTLEYIRKTAPDLLLYDQACGV